MSSLPQIGNSKQWRFQPVPITAEFPFGCKTTNRADSSPQELKSPDQSMSPTGLEPVAVYSRWYPNKDLDPDNIYNRQGVEGTYLLRDIPIFTMLKGIHVHCPGSI